MARVLVTQELADTLRSIRQQNKISAKSLSNHIQKSAAYISKLENGHIQTIDKDELYAILQFILQNEIDPNEAAEKIYASLKYKYSQKEIEEQLWFTNYDTVERMIPIPPSLIDEFNQQIEQYHISYQQLFERINANESLTPQELTDNTIVPNQWFESTRDGLNSQSIKIKLSDTQLKAILNKTQNSSPYVFILCIAYYLLKISQYGTRTVLDSAENKELMGRATNWLNAHRFYSISEKNKLITEHKDTEQIASLLSTFDRENISTINDIIGGFSAISEFDIQRANKQLNSLRENMHWDLGFMMRIMSIEFRVLKQTSVSNRKKLIIEIEELLEKYRSLSDEDNRIETY